MLRFPEEESRKMKKSLPNEEMKDEGRDKSSQEKKQEVVKAPEVGTIGTCEGQEFSACLEG